MAILKSGLTYHVELMASDCQPCCLTPGADLPSVAYVYALGTDGVCHCVQE